MKTASVSEFQRRISLEELDDGEVQRTIEAERQEREALARRFDLIAVDGLWASARVYRVPGGPLVRVEGRLIADIVQHCVVTLAALPVHIEEVFQETFGPAGYRGSPESPELEVPETFDDGAVDLGELAAQMLLLSLNPYPRAPGAETVSQSRPADGADDRVRPFAALSEMLAVRRK